MSPLFPDDTDIVIRHISSIDSNKYLRIPTYAAFDFNTICFAVQKNIRHYTEEFYKNSICGRSSLVVQKTLQMALNYSVCVNYAPKNEYLILL